MWRLTRLSASRRSTDSADLVAHYITKQPSYNSLGAHAFQLLTNMSIGRLRQHRPTEDLGSVAYAFFGIPTWHLTSREITPVLAQAQAGH